MSSYYIEEDDSFTTTTNINESLAEINSLASTSMNPKTANKVFMDKLIKLIN
ncbi:21555_t:CDS:2 [Entrophospora sp. SA101]|nr:21555_t:CDS:2 [Entrophospora sp. SA101]